MHSVAVSVYLVQTVTVSEVVAVNYWCTNHYATR